MQSLKHLVPDFSKRAGIGKQIAAALIVEQAERTLVALLGDDVAKLARPLSVKNKTITISCTTSVVAQAVKLKSKEIVDDMNTKLGIPVVDRVRYVM